MKHAVVLSLVVDYKVACGDNEYMEMLRETERKFYMPLKVFSEVNLPGMTIKMIIYEYNGQQSKHAATQKQLPTYATFEDFQTLRHKLEWLLLSQPNPTAEAKNASQAKMKDLDGSCP